MFSIDDDDQDFLSPTGGSRLASLFGGARVSDESSDNDSLKYTAPKQPRKSVPAETESGSGNPPSLLSACALHAFKYIGGQYASQGKVGAALIANHAANEYKVLLYYSKQQPLMQTRIDQHFQLTVQPNRYASFYDTDRQGWSVMFENDSDLNNFTKQTCIARWLVQSSSTVLVQDALIGDGQELALEDAVEIEYTAYSLPNQQIGKKLDGNVGSEKLLRFKLGRGKINPLLDESLVGMRKSSRRYVIIPHSSLTAAQKSSLNVPPNVSLLYEVLLVRVKFKDPRPQLEEKETPRVRSDTSVSNTSNTSVTPSVADTSADSLPVLGGVKERSRSINEQLSHSPEAESGRAHILSRMARMGQSVMPSIPLAGGATVPGSAGGMTDVTGTSHGGDDDTSSVITSVSQEDVGLIGEGNTHQPRPRPRLPSKPVPPANLNAAFQPYYAPQQQPFNPLVQGMNSSMPSMQAPIGQVVMPGQPQVDVRGLQMMAGQQSVQQPVQQLAVYQPNPHMYPQHQPPPSYAQQTQMAPVYAPAPAPAPAPAVTSTADSGALTVHFSEARTQSTELRLSMSKMSDKLDRVFEKVERFDSRQSGYSNMPTMESGMLLQNLQRIVEENQTLKQQLLERGQKLQQQNDKISQLLNKNLSYVEESHVMVEERSESYKSAAQQSQSRQLQLEQDKVSLTNQLSATMSQISDVTQELNELKRKNLSLTQQLSDYMLNKHDSNSEMVQLKSLLTESELSLKQSTSALNDEKNKRKSAESQLQQVINDVDDLRSSKDTVDKLLNDRKRKSEEERRLADQETDDLKRQHEIEMKRIQEKLRQQISSTNNSTEDKMTKIEDELNADWQRKYDRMVTSLEEKHRRSSQELAEDNQLLKTRIEQITEKFIKLKSLYTDRLSENQSLNDDLDQYKLWPDKYEKLQSGLVTMRSNYDTQIQQLELQYQQSLDKARAMKQRYEDRIQQILDENHSLQDELTITSRELAMTSKQSAMTSQQSGTVATSGGDDKELVNNQIKKCMSQVYHELRTKLSADSSYQGSHVHAIILNTIKETTLKLVSVDQHASSDHESGSDEESETESESESEQPEEVTAEAIKSEQEQKTVLAPRNAAPEELNTNQDNSIREVSRTDQNLTESSQNVDVKEKAESGTKILTSDYQNPLVTSSISNEIPELPDVIDNAELNDTEIKNETETESEPVKMNDHVNISTAKSANNDSDFSVESDDENENAQEPCEAVSPDLNTRKSEKADDDSVMNGLHMDTSETETDKPAETDKQAETDKPAETDKLVETDKPAETDPVVEKESDRNEPLDEASLTDKPGEIPPDSEQTIPPKQHSEQTIISELDSEETIESELNSEQTIKSELNSEQKSELDSEQTVKSEQTDEIANSEGESAAIANHVDNPLNDESKNSEIDENPGSEGVKNQILNVETDHSSVHDPLNSASVIDKESESTANTKEEEKEDSSKSSPPNRAAKPPSQPGIRVPPTDDFSDLFADDSPDDPFGIGTGGDLFTSTSAGKKPNSRSSSIGGRKADKPDDSFDEEGRPQPPPPPLFGDDDSDDSMDWLKT